MLDIHPDTSSVNDKKKRNFVVYLTLQEAKCSSHKKETFDVVKQWFLEVFKRDLKIQGSSGYFEHKGTLDTMTAAVA